MPTKIELTLEQSQQGVSNDVLMIVDIEDDIMDPVMQCTTLPSHSGFSQKKLVSFVTEIHTLSIDISLRDCLDDGVAASFQRSRIHKPHAHTQAFKVNRSTSRSLILNFPTIKEPQTQVDQESQVKMIQVKEMMQDNDLKNSKSKDKGSRSRSQSMNEQSHYKQDKTKTRQSIQSKVISSTSLVVQRSLKKETSTFGEIVSLSYIKSNKNVIGLRKSN
ncbi:hypothetical protein Tco_0866187 [Tanacetum coccineum]